ncbi:MAG: hypothetical protein V1875_08675 [Candidatus Altiarchaeota archaeon]
MHYPMALLALSVLCAGCLEDSSAVQSGSTSSTVLPRDERAGNDTPVYASEDACDSKTDDKLKDLCYINTASTLKDESICDKVKKAQTRELCYGRVGVATKDPRLCDRITDPSVRGQCHLALEQMS